MNRDIWMGEYAKMSKSLNKRMQSIEKIKDTQHYKGVGDWAYGQATKKLSEFSGKDTTRFPTMKEMQKMTDAQVKEYVYIGREYMNSMSSSKTQIDAWFRQQQRQIKEDFNLEGLTLQEIHDLAQAGYVEYLSNALRYEGTDTKSIKGKQELSFIKNLLEKIHSGEQTEFSTRDFDELRKEFGLRDETILQGGLG